MPVVGIPDVLPSRHVDGTNPPTAADETAGCSRPGESDATSGLHFRDQRTSAVNSTAIGNVSVLTFGTDDARMDGQLPQDFAKVSSAIGY